MVKLLKKSIFVPMLLSLIIVIACFSTACQPTPEENIVIGKNNNKESIAISANGDNPSESVSNNVESPPVLNNTEKEIWQDTVESKDTVINIDAKVSSFNSLQTTQIQVKPAGFLLEQFKLFKEGLLGDKELFQYERSEILTKSEIEARIIETKKQINEEQDKGHSGYYYCDPVSGEESVLEADEYINKLMQAYQTAPTTKDKVSVPMEFSESDDGKLLFGMSELDNGNVSSICAYNSSDLKNNLMYYYSNMARSEYAVTAELESDEINGVTLTKNEAIKMADNFISDIMKDGEKFVFNKAYVASYVNDIMTENLDAPPEYDILYDDAKQCFVLYYTKKYTDIDTNYVKFYFDPIVDGLEQSYQRIYEDQYIELYINDNGIIQAQWFNPDEVTEKTDIQRLSLEKIKEIALKQIPLMNWSSDGKDIVINITSVELGMMRIATKNDPNVYQTVPVWDLMGYVEDNQISNFNQSILTINAIDGTIINRAQKY